MNTADLKQLQVRRTKLQAEVSRLDTERKAAQKAHSEAQRELKRLDGEILRSTSGEPIVSEHAMLRYIERVMGINLECVQNEILTDQRKALIKQLGSGRYQMGDHTIVVKDNIVVSILDRK